MTDAQLQQLIKIALADLARIRGGVNAARMNLADVDDQAESARIGLTALSDSLGGERS